MTCLWTLKKNPLRLGINILEELEDVTLAGFQQTMLVNAAVPTMLTKLAINEMSKTIKEKSRGIILLYITF
jgi:hypothetical protein